MFLPQSQGLPRSVHQRLARPSDGNQGRPNPNSRGNPKPVSATPLRVGLMPAWIIRAIPALSRRGRIGQCLQDHPEVGTRFDLGSGRIDRRRSARRLCTRGFPIRRPRRSRSRRSRPGRPRGRARSRWDEADRIARTSTESCGPRRWAGAQIREQPSELLERLLTLGRRDLDLLPGSWSGRHDADLCT